MQGETQSGEETRGVDRGKEKQWERRGRQRGDKVERT
jgi:hypothetical protein